MKVFLCFTFVIAACCGSTDVKWTEIQGGNSILPVNAHQAEKSKWVIYYREESLQITWYKKNKDESFALAFDKNGNCAGAQLTILESEIDSQFIGVYKQPKGIYEQTKVNGLQAYKSTILFAPEKTLKDGGRSQGEAHDVARDVYVKLAGKYTLVSKTGCSTAKTYTEQSCQSKYGLVFSTFTSNSNCKDLIPFYVVYEPREQGHLIGFGWLSFHKVSPKDSFSKKVDGNYIKSKFPKVPACVVSSSNLAVVDVWLSYSWSQKTQCSGSNWTSSHCKSNRESDSSDSDSSSSSD